MTPQKATKHILKSVWDTDSPLCGRWFCFCPNA